MACGSHDYLPPEACHPLCSYISRNAGARVLLYIEIRCEFQIALRSSVGLHLFVAILCVHLLKTRELGVH